MEASNAVNNASVSNDIGRDTVVPINYIESHNQIINLDKINSTGKAKPAKKATESAVLVKNLCKGYKSHGPRVLNNMCMNVKKGTIYGLLGSSGCGKTTVLSCLIGLKRWESGEIEVFGETPGTKESGIPGKRLGYVPQEIALYDQLDAFENTQYYGRLYGMSSQEILEQWSVLVNLLQLPSEFKLIKNMSGGQKRRISLAIALIHSPELLILDEPTVGLDPLLRESVWQHLHEMVRTSNATIIITTHYIEESRNSDTIGVMRHGHLLVEDSPAVLMAQCKTDLLEDVVLKLCWDDTNKLQRMRSCSVVSTNWLKYGDDSDDDDDDDDFDDDSGTGTDNDNVDIDGRSRSNPDLRSVGISDYELTIDGINGINTSSTVLPNDTEVTPNPRAPRFVLTRSKSSELFGSLFHRKWKPELDCVMVSKDTPNPNVVGKYKKSVTFDSNIITTPFPNQRGWNFQQRLRGPKKWMSEVLHSAQRIRALCTIVYICLVRHPIFFSAALVLPALEVLLTISSVGKEPVGLRMAVINEELPDWLTRCAWDAKSIENLSSLKDIDPEKIVTTTMAPPRKPGDAVQCNFKELSCKYLRLASKKGIMDLVPYDTIEKAVTGVEKGELWGYIHFSSNYSQHMIDRLATKQFAFEESINGSTISLRMDMSQYLGSIIVIQDVFDALQGYIQQLIGACDLGARQAEIPLHFRTPVYGTLDANYHSFIIPGILANIMFMMPFAIAGLMFITDLKLGTLGRARVAGLTTVELFIAYTITQGSIVIGQVIICTLCLKLGFNFEIKGSIFLYIACIFLLGMCGQAFGLMLGIISQDEIEALISALFILPLMLMFGGVIWPLDCMAPVWRAIGTALPTTLITESIRSIVIRGVGITHSLLYPGIVVTGSWLIFFWTAALIAYRIFIK